MCAKRIWSSTPWLQSRVESSRLPWLSKSLEAKKQPKKSPRQGIEPWSPALVMQNDKRKLNYVRLQKVIVIMGKDSLITTRPSRTVHDFHSHCRGRNPKRNSICHELVFGGIRQDSAWMLHTIQLMQPPEPCALLGFQWFCLNSTPFSLMPEGIDSQAWKKILFLSMPSAPTSL